MPDVPIKDLAVDQPAAMDALLGGYPWLPRMADKARAAHAGTAGSYRYPCPIDHTLLAGLGVHPDVFQELALRADGDDLVAALHELGVPSPQDAWFDPVALEDGLMEGEPYAKVVDVDDLPESDIAREFVGEDHGSGLTVILVDAPPGRGPNLHSHPYEELIITLEGEATVAVGASRRIVRAGSVLVVPAGAPHRFTNTGAGRLRQIDIHLSPAFATTWLERS